MYAINDLRLFVRTAELENLSAAARELGCTAAAASAAVLRLEKRLGVRLFARSTRRMRLTEEGRLFLPSARAALAALADGEAALAAQRQQLAGPIRLALPSDLGRHLLRPWLDPFLEQHPGITLTLSVGDALTDLVRSNIDLALRYGQLDDSPLVRRQLTLTRRVAVAAPAYLDRHGTPQTPDDLHRHALLPLLHDGQLRGPWRFCAGNEVREIHAEGRRGSDDGALIRDWALAGYGIAFKSWHDVAADVATGRLRLLMPDWCQETVPLQLVFLQNRYPVQRQRQLIEYLQARFTAFDADWPFPAC